MIKESVGKNGFCKQYFGKISCLLPANNHASGYPRQTTANLPEYMVTAAMTALAASSIIPPVRETVPCPIPWIQLRKIQRIPRKIPVIPMVFIKISTFPISISAFSETNK